MQIDLREEELYSVKQFQLFTLDLEHALLLQTDCLQLLRQLAYRQITHLFVIQK